MTVLRSADAPQRRNDHGRGEDRVRRGTSKRRIHDVLDPGLGGSVNESSMFVDAARRFGRGHHKQGLDADQRVESGLGIPIRAAAHLGRKLRRSVRATCKHHEPRALPVQQARHLSADCSRNPGDSNHLRGAEFSP